ncbi:MAG TPA: hypothetical protein VKV15_27285 [Bryobacteraceae bacterium]|nr:hypothetical protein [Bryobacteraceae bacterium]
MNRPPHWSVVDMSVANPTASAGQGQEATKMTGVDRGCHAPVEEHDK